jgi:hypothetical protein
VINVFLLVPFGSVLRVGWSIVEYLGSVCRYFYFILLIPWGLFLFELGKIQIMTGGGFAVFCIVYPPPIATYLLSPT